MRGERERERRWRGVEKEGRRGKERCGGRKEGER